MPKRPVKWSLRRAAISRPRGRRPPGPKRTAETTSPNKTPWLADAEDLLHSVISFGWRATGSLVLGFALLFRASPSKRLEALEKDGHVLSWATLLVTSAAAFSALFPVAFGFVETSPYDWMTAAMQASNVAGYLERFLPTLAVGLIATSIACLPRLAWGRVHDVHGPRLFASTLIAISLVCSLAESATFRYLVIADHGKFIADWLEARAIEEQRANLVVAFGALSIWVVPVCLACAVAAARAAWRVSATRLPIASHVLARFTTAAACGLAALFVPILIFVATCAATLLTEPLASRMKNFFEPDYVAEFTPLEPRCIVTDTTPETSLDCTLTAKTAGKGYVFLDFGDAALVLSDHELGDKNNEHFRLRDTNAIAQDYKVVSRDLDAETIPADVAWSLTFPSPIEKRPVLPLELGKPFVATLHLRLPLACLNSPGYHFRPGHLYSLMYLRARPLREHSLAPDDYAAIGPWKVPSELFERHCPPE